MKKTGHNFNIPLFFSLYFFMFLYTKGENNSFNNIDLTIENPSSNFLSKNEAFIIFALLYLCILLIISFILYRQFIVKKLILELQVLQAKFENKDTELKELSTIDSLTGLSNRKLLDKKIELEMNRNKRFQIPFSILLIDIDHFKIINDTYGHQVGDEVLENIGNLIKKSIRSVDTASRWGGEEFLILAANSDLVSAIPFAEKLRKQISAFNFIKAQNVSISIGITEYQSEETFKSLYERAEEALHEAKSGGRNKVVYKEVKDKPPRDSSKIRLKWSEQYLSGNALIDSQHTELFNLTNKLVTLTIFKIGNDNIYELINSILEKTIEHFNTEEELLAKIHYHDLENHRLEHHDLLKQLILNVERFKNKDINDIDFLLFISQTLVAEHMIEEDQNYFYKLF